MLKKILIFTLIINIYSFSFAQTNNLNSQFQIMKAQSTNYQEFKVIPLGKLDGFWNIVLDTLKQNHNQISSLQKQLTDKQSEIASLKLQLSEKENQLKKNDYESSRVSVLGMKVMKDGYVWFSFIVIGLLVFLFVFIFIKYKAGDNIITEARKDALESKNQVEGLRQRILEVQTQLGRELQNERNKAEDLLQKISALKK